MLKTNRRPFLFLLNLVAICSIVVIVCGCGRKKESGVVITFVHEDSVALNPIYTSAIKQFEEKHPNIKVKDITVGGLYYPKIQTMIAGGSSPDIMWMGRGFGEFAYRGVFLNLEPLIAKDKTFNLSLYYPQAIDLYKYKGSLCGFPLGLDISILVYNKNLFDEAEISYPTETWTYSDLLKAAKKLTRDINGDGKTDQWGVVMEAETRPNLGAFGGALLNKENTRCLLDTPESIRALQFLVDLMRKHKVHPVVVERTVGGVFPANSFMMGKVGMYYSSSWMINDYRKQIKDFKWDVALFPKEKEREHWVSSQGFAIYKGTRYPEESFLLLKHLVGRDFQKTVSRFTVPSLKEVSKEILNEQKDIPPANIGLLLKAIEYAEPDPRIPFVTEIISKKMEEEDLAFLGKKTPQQAYKSAAEKINLLLNRIPEMEKGGGR